MQSRTHTPIVTLIKDGGGQGFEVERLEKLLHEHDGRLIAAYKLTESIKTSGKVPELDCDYVVITEFTEPSQAIRAFSYVGTWGWQFQTLAAMPIREFATS